MNTKRTGNKAVASAIVFFVGCGADVFVPVGDPPDVDLVVLFGGRVKRVQCKWSSSSPVPLRVGGGNRSRNTHQKYADDAFDWLWVGTPDRDYLVPWSSITARNAVALSVLVDFDICQRVVTGDTNDL